MRRLQLFQSILLPVGLAAAVVALSLVMHQRTFSSVTRLMETAGRLEETQRWFQRAEQCVLELIAPANAVFADWDVASHRGRLHRARLKLDEAIAQGRSYGLNVTRLTRLTEEMAAGADEVFENVMRMREAGADSGAQAEALTAASRAMARADEKQMSAVRELGLLTERVRAEQRNILEEHEVSLQARLTMERYVVTLLVLLALGMAWFGWRLRQTDRALAAQRRATEAAQRERLAAIGELCSSVAHGIRNPLAAIRSSTQLTLDLGKLDDASRARLQDVLIEGTRLGDRVSGLLKMARAGSESFEDVCLQDVVAGAVSGLGPELERLGLTLKRELAADPIVVRGDRHQLEQLVVELVSNAMEHSPRGESIIVACQRPGANGRAVLAVDDAGPGVPDAVRSSVFQLFFTTKEHGTGIGLATVKGIARLHEGDVTLARSARGGARFEVTLPTTRT
ncbi:MAG: hypothetical protein HBSAPP02_12110 [Phycisphaerae bacterium]|nr:MAG: HAMP domain-containing histidine kinase [Planctomycetia bacterium]RIK70509.1 MAG: hypothetical protein DCC66_04280 [Planctomycetota bacterium]GJQ26179.1 MAG: hypothetical protein HBSAPP02_12110 [Phycisphaerae bacterium]